MATFAGFIAKTNKPQRAKTSIQTALSIFPINNNNNDFLCANILEDRAQWRDKTKALSNLVIVEQCVSRQWIDERARKLGRVGSIKAIGF